MVSPYWEKLCPQSWFQVKQHLLHSFSMHCKAKQVWWLVNKTPFVTPLNLVASTKEAKVAHSNRKTTEKQEHNIERWRLGQNNLKLLPESWKLNGKMNGNLFWTFLRRFRQKNDLSRLLKRTNVNKKQCKTVRRADNLLNWFTAWPLSSSS